MKSSDTSPLVLVCSSADSQSACRGMHFSTEQDNAPSEPESMGSPSCDNVYSADLKGSGWRSGRAKTAAVLACPLDSKLSTIEGFSDCAASDVNAFREFAIREGILRENAMRGCGSSAMEEKEESVAPWKRRELEDCPSSPSTGSREVTTATGCPVSLNSARKASFVVVANARRADGARQRCAPLAKRWNIEREK